MELRHLRYFVAVADEGSLTRAAELRLHTAQPSLSRQIRELEEEVRAPLFVRSTRGVELTTAGQAFLSHARMILAQVEAAGEAARRASVPHKPSFAVGFLTGQEMDWLPAALRILREELPNVDVTVSSDASPRLADALVSGKVDAAFLRHEPKRPELQFGRLVAEPLVAVLPSDHPLAAARSIGPRDLKGQVSIGVADNAPQLKALIRRYRDRAGLDVAADHEVDNLSMAISLVSSTRGIALLPRYAENFLPRSVVSRPLKGRAPTIDLVLGYRKDNPSPLLRFFASQIDALIAAATRPRA